MGIDLTFLPLEHESERLAYSHTLLPLERRYDLQDEVRALNPKSLGRVMSSYLSRNKDGEICYGDTNEDCYGEALTYLTVAELLQVNPTTIQYKNKAIWAYLKELPLETKIVLYWS
jgi:hypothetical protein